MTVLCFSRDWRFKGYQKITRTFRKIWKNCLSKTNASGFKPWSVFGQINPFYPKRISLESGLFTGDTFGIEGRIWDVIVLIPDHCFSIYFSKTGTFVDE